MNDRERGLHSAMARLQLAEEKLAEDPDSVHWHRVWRDASDQAVKWQRECRREGDGDDLDRELDRLLTK